MISRHEMRERGEALNRMMAEADERNAKLNAKLNQEADRDAKIAQLMASATATARATQFALDGYGRRHGRIQRRGSGDAYG